MSKKKRKKKKAPERNVYAFAIPILTLVTVMSSVFLWSYSTDRLGDSFKGYAAEGRTAEAFLGVMKQPLVLIVAAALLMFNAASFAAVAGAIKAKRQGAWLFLLLIIINVASFPAIMFAAAFALAE